MSSEWMEQTDWNKQHLCPPVHTFRLGRRDALTVIRENRASHRWTDEVRSRWLGETSSGWRRVLHRYPDDRSLISYYAGFVSVLKSARSLASVEQTRERRKEICDALACFR